MVDETIIPPPNIDEAGSIALPPQAGQPAAENRKKNDNPESTVLPEAAIKNSKREDHHPLPPTHFRWHAEVLVDGKEVFQVVLKDISIKGCNVLLDHNLQNAKLVKLHIHVPPLVSSHPHQAIEVTGKVTSTIYDSNEDSFRSGVVFGTFSLESDREYLYSRIADQ